MEQIDINKRFMYHPLKEGQTEKYLTIRAVAKTLAELVNEVCPESREKSLAMTALEESVMWAYASIARNDIKGEQL
jgi:L-serine deaminase